MKIMPLRAYNEQFPLAMGAMALNDGQAFAKAAVLIRVQAWERQKREVRKSSGPSINMAGEAMMDARTK
ncbi:hypothetical protein [Desulfatibacillum aliphaticivorans]|uniref:hypothetical protein n=1 Tax=Desulfatibacillum aliphaticivorans TaxID=218208 RepID=UPI00047F14D1|nr:hypothetical protein [Desulfatibacillum aliphaticivorans]